jgi:hypothetical protein
MLIAVPPDNSRDILTKNGFADFAKRFFKRKMTLQTLRNDFSNEKRLCPAGEMIFRTKKDFPKSGKRFFKRKKTSRSSGNDFSNKK